MCRPHTNCILAVILVFLVACWGCDRGGADGTPAEKAARSKVEEGARLLIETGTYLPEAPGIYKPWVNGGLDTLGDIDADGYADLIVGSGKYPGSFAAFSGKDGRELWRVRGRTSSTAQEAGEGGYIFGDFALIPDQNSDGVPEVFIRNDWTDREAFIFSGKDGSRIMRSATGVLSRFRPVRVYDVNDDGIDDLIFLRGYLMAVQALSAKDLSETLNREAIIGLPPEVWQSWLLPSYPDLDGDGIDEYLIGVRQDAASQWVFVSGKDFSVLKRVPVFGDLASGLSKLYCAGDLNGDGQVDLVVTKNIGAEVDKDVSFLGAVSGTDASKFWQIAGSSLPGGPARIRVDAKTGQRRELPGDVGFGDRPEILVDLDGDGAREIACALPTIVDGKRTQGVLVFSGATGEHLLTLALSSRQGRLLGKQMLLIDNFAPNGAPALAVSGQLGENKYTVAIFDLPKIKR